MAQNRLNGAGIAFCTGASRERVYSPVDAGCTADTLYALTGAVMFPMLFAAGFQQAQR